MRREPKKSSEDGIDLAVAQFGREVTKKLLTRDGSPEDHLRAPFERMLRAIAHSLGLTVTAIGETRLPDLAIRPDYAVDVAGARVGYVELKRPGYGIPENWPAPKSHDLRQWQSFRLLPNVLYSDGEQFARYSFGTLQGRIGRLEPGLQTAGGKLHAVGNDFGRTMSDFLLWEPERPRSLDALVRVAANLCRLLRDDVLAELERERTRRTQLRTFTELAMDWRQALFPQLTDSQFADQYAQTITFALLLARVEGVSFTGRAVSEIARQLGKKHSLMGRALTVLTDQPEEQHSIALTTMIRVFSVVDWADFPEDTYAMLFENFLSRYDPQLRRQSGIYYTPTDLVAFMTNFVDDLLRSRLARPRGFAERDVIVVDPAMGTGSFLAEVINTVARTIKSAEGAGAVGPHLRELSNRLIGFENQAAPYAVAELRIHSLLKKRHRAEAPAHERRFLADALDNPNAQQLPLGRMYEAIERSRRGANQVKQDEPVMVVIGNPPYVDKVKGSASWIETAVTSRSAAPSLTAFRKPGNGRREYVLSNKYIYFWRWATWKAFDAHPGHPAGVIAMVCSSGFTTGPGFAGMREYLRRTADEGWIVDLTPEGHQPPMATRYFRGNQQPICVAVFIRRSTPAPEVPAAVHWTKVTGTVRQKTEALRSLNPDDLVWQRCATGWTDPLRPAIESNWAAMPALPDLMPWASPGLKPNRTWVYAPEQESLASRWSHLTATPARERGALLKETRDRTADSSVAPLPGHAPAPQHLLAETARKPALARIAHRPFDRKWIVADSRVIDRPRPALWSVLSESQLFITEQHAHPIESGPALLFSSLLPDMHHHSGRGGRIFPLYRDADGNEPNLAPGLLTFLRGKLQHHLTTEDIAAYIAAVTAHRGFTHRFHAELQSPGVRVPITTNRDLWTEAVQIGRAMIALHTFGERGPAHLELRRLCNTRPMVEVAIPDIEDAMPSQISYEPSTLTLRVGPGEIRPVTKDVWDYQVAGMHVVKHWFGYRKQSPTGVRSSDLDSIVATTWGPALTTELLELICTLEACIALEEPQKELLDKILESPVVTVTDLRDASILPPPVATTKPPKVRSPDSTF